MPVGHVAELRHKQDDLALCDNCGTYIYLPPDEMAVSPIAPARRGRARTPPNEDQGSRDGVIDLIG
jgi:hypothetical protein